MAIVGISVASVSAVVLAAGVLFLLACLRKRDRKKEEEAEASEKQGRSKFALTPPSHDNVAMSPSALAQFPSPPRNRRDPRNGAGVGTGGITIPQVRVVDPSPPRSQRAPTPLENIGLAITEDSPVASPASFASSRTVSQLLPDKPEPVHPRKPEPVPKSPVPTSAPFIEKRKKRESSMSQNTVFEEDTAVRKPMYPVRAVQVPPRQDAPAKAPPIRPYRPPPSFAQEYTASPAEEKTRQPSLSLAIPPQGRQYARQPTPSPPPIPSPLRIGVARPPNVAKPPLPLYQQPAVTGPHSSGASSGSTKFTGTNSTASSSYIPAYYTSPPTSIMQTPPESYGHATSDAGGFSGPPRPLDAAAPPAFLGHSSSSSRPFPQRQAQTSATAPPPTQTHTHQMPVFSAAAQNRAMPPQPALAHLPGQTTGQQAPAPLQGSHANPPALRQPSPPQPPVGRPVPVAAAVRHHHQQQEQDHHDNRQAPLAFPTPANQRSGPSPSSSSTPLPSSSTRQPPPAAAAAAPTQQGGQYRPYNVSYARPPLPPQPQSPPRPRQTARPPLVKGPQRSTSSASMTSFESASLPGDPSPPTEDDNDEAAKRLGVSGAVPAPVVAAGDSSSSSSDDGDDTTTSHSRRHPQAVITAPSSSSTLRVKTTPPQQQLCDDGSVEDKSPISDIKYPKVPRASNQAVPRTSPNAGSHRTGTPSPRVQQQHQQHAAADGGGDGSSAAAADGSPKGGLQARRRPGREGNGLLIIDSGAPSANASPGNSRRTTPTKKVGGRSPHTPQGQIIRTDGTVPADRHHHDPDQARKSSAALPDAQQQAGQHANWPSYEGGGQGDVAIKTPMWAPRLTPTRRGDDLYLAVAYASKEGISG
ncbi:hypothetical protein SLS55_002681 [Diplodia seriata]|uniref:Uncharacterized protein n=1 Tax=Diplodia seriata TaxID=420778 RepID=A0ABR3CTY6_9PEZI